VGKLANCAENHRRARATGPEYRALGGEVGITCVTNHVSGAIDGVTGQNEIGVNEFPSWRGKRNWCARAASPERGMAFNKVCGTAVAENIPGGINACGPAERKVFAELRKINR